MSSGKSYRCSCSKVKESLDRGALERRRPLFSPVRVPALELPRWLARAEPAGVECHAQAFGHLSQSSERPPRQRAHGDE